MIPEKVKEYYDSRYRQVHVWEDVAYVHNPNELYEIDHNLTLEIKRNKNG